MGNSHDRRSFKRLLERLRKEIIVEPPRQAPSPISTVRGFISAGFVPLVFGLLWAYRATTGITDMDTARGILVITWLVIVVGIATSAPVWARPFRHRLGMGCLFAVISAVGLFGCDWWVVKHFVTVTPNSTFTLSAGWAPTETRLYITNKSDSAVYAAWLKVTIETPGVFAKYVQVQGADNLSRPDIWFSGRDGAGRDCAFIVFLSIAPHRTNQIVLRDSVKALVKARATIIGFRLEPNVSTANFASAVTPNEPIYDSHVHAIPRQP